MKASKMICSVAAILTVALYLVLLRTSVAKINRLSGASSAGVDDVNIIIDPGHGGEDGGAVDNNIVEKDINLSISDKLAKVLRVSGFRVTTTRSDDVMINTEGDTLKARKVSDMKNRLAIFNGGKNNVVISIHQNKFTQEQYSGAQIFYSLNSKSSALLAENLRESIVSFVQPENERQCKPADRNIYLLYNSTVPAVIVECGFISNYSEAEKLADDKYQNKLAYSICCGFINFYNKNMRTYYG